MRESYGYSSDSGIRVLYETRNGITLLKQNKRKKMEMPKKQR